MVNFSAIDIIKLFYECTQENWYWMILGWSIQEYCILYDWVHSYQHNVLPYDLNSNL